MKGLELPLPSELIENEIHTLEVIKNDKAFWENYSDFSTDANNSYHHAINHSDSFNFESYINISLDGREGKAYIGALIIPNNTKNNYDQVTYSLAICEGKGNKKKLLKKFHFDYIDSHKSHPVFHLQSPGTLTPRLEKDGFKDKHLFPEVSEPRIPFFPMTLALLVNLVLKEFPDSKSDKIIELNEWRGLIKKNEEYVLKPYFMKCNSFFERRENQIPGNNLLTNDFYYGLN